MARPTRSSSKSTVPTPPQKTTPQKSRKSSHNQTSKYFEPATSEESSFSEVSSAHSPSPASTSPLETSDDDNDVAPPRKKAKVTRKKQGSQKSTPKKVTPRKKGKKDEEHDEEEPWETFVPKEDTPEAGDVSYKNETIHPNTLQFLKGYSNSLYSILTVDLVENNDRDWFWSHEVDPFIKGLVLMVETISRCREGFQDVCSLKGQFANHQIYRSFIGETYGN
jgi:hypothetical protein